MAIVLAADQLGNEYIIFNLLFYFTIRDHFMVIGTAIFEWRFHITCKDSATLSAVSLLSPIILLKNRFLLHCLIVCNT